MAQVKKRKLSGSTDGRATKVVATATPGTLIHTAATTVVTAGAFDEVWLWCQNTSAAAVLLTLQWGGTTAPDDSITVSVPANSTLLVAPGWIIQNTVIVRAFAAVANVLTIVGFVNQMTP